MKISLKWLNEFVDLKDLTPVQVADALTARGFEVEDFSRQDKGFEKVVVGQIVQKLKHPEADRLSLCTVNPKGLDAESSEFLEIVCGAQNMKVGDKVPLALPGAQLPNGAKIEKGKIRGVVSNGMLCSEQELGLKDTSDGLLIFPQDTPVGWAVADVLGLDDTLFTLKLTANRGDGLSHRGIARELAAHFGRKLIPMRIQDLSGAAQATIAVSTDVGEDAPQFFGVEIRGVKVGPSPGWLRRRLDSIGSRSINNVVDVSNLLMFELGFPVHIYDRDRLQGDRIYVAKSVLGESLKLLDESTVRLTGEELVIKDSSGTIGLAGVMGGASTEVRSDTKNVFLECAEFNPTLVRRAAFRFQKRSEASLRFEKGIDAGGLREAISRLSELVVKVCGGEVTGVTQIVTPWRNAAAEGRLRRMTASLSKVNAILGMAVDRPKTEEILSGLGFKVSGTGDLLSLEIPSYRLDIDHDQDIAEEIARSLGYDAIPSTIPALTSAPALRHGQVFARRQEMLERTKDVFASLGMRETMSFAFASDAAIRATGVDPEVKIQNPMSQDQAWMVPSLLPGLLAAYSVNDRHHFGSEPLSVRLFELRPVFLSDDQSQTKVREPWHLSFLLSGFAEQTTLKTAEREIDFYDVKAAVESWIERLGLRGVRLRPIRDLSAADQVRFHPGQVMEIVAGKERVGAFGRIHPKLQKEITKRQTPIFWGEWNMESVIKLWSSGVESFQSWSSFPTMERDFSLLVGHHISADQITQVLFKAGKPLVQQVRFFDRYTGPGLAEGQSSVSVRVIFGQNQRSLEESEVETASVKIIDGLKKDLGLTLRA